MTHDPHNAETAHWVSQHRIWGLMSATHQAALLTHSSVQPCVAGSQLFAAGAWGEQLCVVIKGQLGLQNSATQHTLTLQAGELLGAGVSNKDLIEQTAVVALTEAEILLVDAAILHELLTTEESIRAFFPLPLQSTMGAAGATPSRESDLFNISLHEVMSTAPVTVSPQATAMQAAQLMRQHGVSSLLLVDDDQLIGIVTDRDLRNRVVAEGLDLSTQLSEVATPTPLTLTSSHRAFEAMLMLARHHIHHVPVVDEGRIAGMVTASDLYKQNNLSAVYMSRDIHEQKSLPGLVKISQRLKLLQQHLATSHASAYTTGHIITTLTDAFTVRLIQLAHAELGPAPVPYLWVAAGSQARNEQTAKSDQDNCMILDDSYDPGTHGAYFKAFTQYVCDGLDACGYVHCPGEMMAMTDKWRQPLAVWRAYFREWVHKPEPMSLMLSSVFFDMRPVHGDAELMSQLRQEMLYSSKGNTLFLGHMVNNALKLRPPLGMFGGISLIRKGEHAGTVDLKHNGLAPIVDLGRIYALAGGLSEVNTHDRLEKAADSGEVSPQSARDLRDALEFLSGLRIQHQTQRMLAGLEANNYLALHELSNLERSHLKDAFGVIHSLQTVLGQRYHF